MFRKDKASKEEETFFKEDQAIEDADDLEDREEDESKPQRPSGISELMQSVQDNISKQMSEEKGTDEVAHLDIVIKLLRGEPIISDPVEIGPHLSVRFRSLTSKHYQMISSLSVNTQKTDEEGNPIVDEALMRSLTMGMMWHSLNDEILPDVLSREDGFTRFEHVALEIEDREKTLKGWPPEWTRRFEQGLVEFNDMIKKATESSNVQNFSKAPSESS